MDTQDIEMMRVQGETMFDGEKIPLTTIEESIEREVRLEALFRSVLPALNLSNMAKATREGILRDFSELRAGGAHGQTVTFTMISNLPSLKDINLSSIEVSGLEGVMMRIPGSRAGIDFMIVVPDRRVMESLKCDRMCLRRAILHEQSRIFMTNEGDQGVARALTGPIHEYLLPEEGFFISCLYGDAVQNRNPEP